METMTDTNPTPPMATAGQSKNNKETEIEMLARLVVNGFAEVKEQIGGLQGQVNGLQGQINGLENQFEDLRGEMRAGFENNRIEHKEMNEHLVSLDRKQMGAMESLDETVLKSDFDELTERVVVLETKFA
jgi:uncharacterized protein HemX